MASKRPTPLDDPPSASSDDEETEDEPEEEEEDDDDDESEEEEEEDDQQQSKPQNPLETPKIQNPDSKAAESSSEEESESESEEQTPPRVETPIETSKTLTPKSSTVFDFDTDPDLKSPTASDFAIKPSKKVSVGEKTPTSKRLFAGSDLKEKKKMKVSNGDVDDEKKSVVKRVWSDDDELLLLQGFIDYQSKKGCSPLSDMEGFYQFTMDSLPGNASKSQLYEKIRRLKKKFRVNSEKMSENGEDPVFQKPHERKLFEVSKKIWGVDGCETLGALNAHVKSKTKTKPKIEMKEEEEEEEDEDDVKVVAKVEDFETLYPFLSAGLKSDVSSSLNFPSGVVHLIKEKLSLIGEAKAKELNEKWKAYFSNETMLRKRRIALLSNVAELGASVGK